MLKITYSSKSIYNCSFPTSFRSSSACVKKKQTNKPTTKPKTKEILNPNRGKCYCSGAPPTRRFQLSANFTFPMAPERLQVGRKKMEPHWEEERIPFLGHSALLEGSKKYCLSCAKPGWRYSQKSKDLPRESPSIWSLGGGCGCSKAVEKQNQFRY